eukprot:1339094-Pyramimonas_sp.AAC.1
MPLRGVDAGIASSIDQSLLLAPATLPPKQPSKVPTMLQVAPPPKMAWPNPQLRLAPTMLSPRTAFETGGIFAVRSPQGRRGQV